MKKILFFFCALSLNAMIFAQQKINTEKSEISFSVTNLGANIVEGTLEGLEGNVTFDPYDVEAASFDIRLETETIHTGNGLRDKHLKNKKQYFYSKIFPTIEFKSSKVIESDDGRSYKVLGELTIKETTKEIEIPFKFVEKENGVQLTGSIELSRLDYGIGGEGTNLIGEEVAVKIVCFIE